MKIFSYHFSDITIKRQIIEQCLGYPDGNLPEPFPGLIDEAYKMAPELCAICAAYVEVEKVDLLGGVLQVGDKQFYPGKKVIKLLNKIETAIFFVATAGSGMEDISKKEMAEGDMMKGWVIDMLASNVVEGAVEKMHKCIESEMEVKGLKVTNRYSPGYCDWSVNEQHDLFSFFPENPLGIVLSDTALMHPIKSVSGIIGVGKKVKYNPYTCEMCNSKNCIYRNVRKVG